MSVILELMSCSLVEIYERFRETYSICFGSNVPKTEKVGVPEVPVLLDYKAVHTKRQYYAQSPLR
jgi:hypothetical protein